MGATTEKEGPVYQRPDSLADLWRCLAGADGRVGLLAGGTDLVPAMKQVLVRPVALVDVKRIPELQGIAPSPNGGLRVGAAVTLHELARSPEVVAACPTLAGAAGTVASYQVRNRGTLGGNLCLDTRCTYFNRSPFWRAEYPDCRKTGGGSCYVVPKGDRCHALSSSDLAPLLIALGAGAEIAAPSGVRIVPLEAIYADDGVRPLTLERDEVLAAVVLPAPHGARTAYRRFSLRETVDFPMLSVAATVNGDGEARVVVGHATSRPVRAPGAEAALAALLRGEGVGADEVGRVAAGEVRLTSSVRGSVGYKRRMLRVLITAMATELSTGRSKGD